MRSLAKGNDGRIYAGTEGDFGYLAPDSAGMMKYHSLGSVLDEKEKNFTEIWTINISGDTIYFCSNEKIFVYDCTTGNISFIRPETSFTLVFMIRNSLFTIQKNVGLTEIINTRKQIIRSTDSLENISGAFDFGIDSVLLLIENKLFLYAADRLILFKNEAEQFLVENIAYRGIKLPGPVFSFNTINKGVITINKKGKILSVFNKNIGLNSETMLSQYLDKDGNLWIGTENGISKIETGNPITEFDERNGLMNTVNTIFNFRGVIYAGTSNGVYCLNKGLPGEPDRFYQLDKIKWQVFDMISYRNKLIAATGDGLYVIDGLIPHAIHPGVDLAFACLTASGKYPGIIYAGGFHYCYIFEFTGNEWRNKGQLDGITEDIHTIAETAGGDLWLGTYSEGVIKADMSAGFSLNSPVKKFSEKNGLPEGWVQVIKMDEKIFFGTAAGLFRYNPVSDSFYPDSSLSPLLSDGSHDVVDLIRRDSDIFILTRGNLAIIQPGKEGKNIFNQKPFLRNEKEEFFGIAADTAGNVWAGGPMGIICFNNAVEKNFNKTFTTLIRLAVAGKDTLFYGAFAGENFCLSEAQPVWLVKAIPYQHNNLYFEFSATAYEDESANKYVYYLDGFDNEWSSPSTDNKKQYTNLPEGDYRFRVKGIDKYGNKGKEALFAFSVMPPWYRTLLAYAGYVLLLIFTIYGAVQISIMRLRAAKNRLENIVRERTAEIVQKNIQLEKLSIVARETDNGVLIAGPSGNIEWVNEGFIRMHGFTLDEFKSKRGDNLISASANPEIPRVIEESIRSKKSVIYESVNTSKSGRDFWVQSTLTPILDDNGSVKKLVIIDSDITARKKQEEIISQQNREILDSIEYASYIQRSMLPSEEEFRMIFPEAFIIFKPKDIVSGDFYWVAQPPQPPEGGIIQHTDDVYGYQTADPFLYGQLKDFVKEHRSVPTEAEKIFWELIRGKRLDGYKFRRQHIIGYYIADFVCLQQKLVVEIDGLIHELPEHKTSDEERTRYLNKKGFSVIRFTNNEIIGNPDGVIEKVLYQLKLCPSQNPPSGGRGAVLLCIADCTGHGVPGAFMSMLCTALLNEAVNDKDIKSPEAIFEEVRNGIISALKQRGQKGDTADGMDAVLINVQYGSGEEKKTGLHTGSGNVFCRIACANNPLYIVKNPAGNTDKSGKKLITVKGDRFPVGIYPGELKPFTLKTVSLQRNDMVYLLSDGFPDQLGGVKGRKFQSSHLEELLLSMAGKPIPVQQEILLKTLEEWKGREEQTDDVTVIGIRI
ncbi:MAG: DUF559 domain-containing protein [Bacteroidetes bacterium]|nr:DUF559 domain-containing protein [Bacteroidota bacterium]